VSRNVVKTCYRTLAQIAHEGVLLLSADQTRLAEHDLLVPAKSVVVFCSVVPAFLTVDGSLLLVAVRANSSCVLHRRRSLGSWRRHAHHSDCQ